VFGSTTGSASGSGSVSTTSSSDGSGGGAIFARNSSRALEKLVIEVWS